MAWAADAWRQGAVFRHQSIMSARRGEDARETPSWLTGLLTSPRPLLLTASLDRAQRGKTMTQTRRDFLRGMGGRGGGAVGGQLVGASPARGPAAQPAALRPAR